MAQASYLPAKTLIKLITEAARDDDFAWIQAGKLALGLGPPQAARIIDLGTEQISDTMPDVGTESAENSATAPDLHSTAARHLRTTGRYMVEVRGKRTECRSLKEVLAEGLRVLETLRPGTLEKLSTIRPRTKRIVARDPNQLFDQQELVQKYAEKLMEGWWFGTNNSAEETISWLKRACDLAGLKWNTEFKVK